jgi:ABC-type branched-subunit amino acid transport system substrate-binding protein
MNKASALFVQFRRGLRRWSVALAVSLGALVWLAGPSGAQAQAPKEIVIGGTLGLSGAFAGVVKPFKDLAEAWAKEINAQGGIYLKDYKKKLPVRFVIYDDQSEPPTALKLYERLATVDKVDVFIGPFSSFLTNAALQASSTHKIPFFMVEANDEELFEKPNPWRATGLAPAETEYDRVFELYKRLKGLKTVALLGRDNLHERGSIKGIADRFRANGFQVVYENQAPKDIKDFASIILAMKEKNPDVVVVEALPPPWTIGFLKQARELGLNPKEVIAGHVGLPLVKAMGSAGDNIVSFTYYFDGDSTDHKLLYAISQAAGVEPWMYPETGLRFRAFRRIEDALIRAGSLDHEKVREAMWSTNMVLFGEEHLKHDQRGYGSDIPYPVQIRDGKLISLWPIAKGVETHRFKNGKW